MKYENVEFNLEMLLKKKIFRGTIEDPDGKIVFYAKDYETFEKELIKAVNYIKEKRKKINHYYKMKAKNYRKPFAAMNSKSGETRIFEKQSEAAKELNLNVKAICYCLLGTQKSTKGFTFRYLQ